MCTSVPAQGLTVFSKSLFVQRTELAAGEGAVKACHCSGMAVAQRV